MSGLRQVVRFNAPIYALSVVGVVLGLVFGYWGVSPWNRLGLTCAMVAGWFTVASLLATWWAYDGSRVYHFDWLVARLSGVQRWCILHAGLDDVSPLLSARLGGEQRIIDILPGDALTASLRRARAHGVALGLSMTGGKLPLSDGWADAVVMAFAAHELRSHEQRVSIFLEARRVLADQGRVWLVEHFRDVPNILAYGPGAWHFHPRSAWLAAISSAGLRVSEECRLNAFVRLWVLSR